MFYYFLILHWIGDFVLQTNKMITKKSESYIWLCLHTLTYSFVFFIGLLFFIKIETNIDLLVVILIVHFLIDLNMNRFKKKWPGFEQLLHIISLYYFYNKIFL